MALQSVEDLVRGWLPWLPAAGVNTTLDAQITAYKINTYYFLQPYYGFTDAQVEVDANYTGIKRLLAAALVTYDLIQNKVLINLSGNVETLASVVFGITGGTLSAGVNRIVSIKINGITITSAAIDHTGNNDTTAAAVAANILAFLSNPNYNASVLTNQVTVQAVPGSGSSPNGFVLEIITAGDVTVSGNLGQMAGGVGSSVAGAGAKRIKKAKADVVEAEFDYAKSSDGTTLTSQTSSIVSDLKSKICAYAATLQINLPMCDCQIEGEIMNFKAYVCGDND
jgi:hypothetical protein